MQRTSAKQKMAVRVTAIFAFAIIPLIACRRHTQVAGSLHFEDTVTPAPPRVGHSRLDLNITHRDASAVRGAKIQVEADMTHAGMAPVFSDAVETTPGHYQAPLALNMAGDWVLLLHVREPDGRSTEHQIDLRGVEPK